MSLLTGPRPRPCTRCLVGGTWGRRCQLREAIRAETGRDVACRVCGTEPGPQAILITDSADRWYCMAHAPGEER